MEVEFLPGIARKSADLNNLWLFAISPERTGKTLLMLALDETLQ